MGMNVGGSARGLHTEINITPLIDVVLVLLIIFLVTMPINMKMIPLDVPRHEPEPAPTSTVPVIIKVLATTDIELEDDGAKQNIEAGKLASTLRPILERKLSEKVVFVDFEDQVPWGDVVSTMDVVRSLAPSSNPSDIKVALKLKVDPTEQSTGG